ncbi:hypothetical protein MNF30_00575 [Mycoplasma mycoides subsp. capri]|uniref:hypothetical protein n=1 Tax=Mycoplasma mycoides TaxID=2102 RepID=UPI0022407E7A|nr:hypothetical protein [Mycoplasma mycoides]UZK64308.1 hypothetical protein MNF30_00575 [Mycoplasma mycoides subsp. capri]
MTLIIFLITIIVKICPTLIEQLEQDYKFLLVNQEEADKLLKEYEDQKKEINKDLSKKTYTITTLEKQITEIQKENSDLDIEIKNIKNMKSSLVQEVKFIQTTIDNIINKKPDNADKKIKDSISKIDDVINLMETWKQEKWLHLKPYITDHPKNIDLSTLEEHFKYVEKEIKIQEEFSNILDQLIDTFNNKYDDDILKPNQ